MDRINTTEPAESKLIFVTRNTQLAKQLEEAAQNERVVTEVRSNIPRSDFLSGIILDSQMVPHFLNAQSPTLPRQAVVIYQATGTPEDELALAEFNFGDYVRGELSCRVLQLRL